MNDSQLVKTIQNLISTTVEKMIDDELRGKYLMSRKAVIVKSYDLQENRATIYIPTDPNLASNYSYYNRTGGGLLNGQKVYLVYQLNSISQGWLENIYPLDTINKVYALRKDYTSKTLNDMTNNVGFAYEIASDGSGMNGSFISFSGLNNQYQVQIMTAYSIRDTIKFRTHNGDNGIWSAWTRLPVIIDNDPSYETSIKFTRDGNGVTGIDTWTYGVNAGWLRSPVNGFLPSSTNGDSDLGTNDYRFSKGYFKNFVQTDAGYSYQFKNSNSYYAAGSVELYNLTPFIDFHYNNDTKDYTSRIIADGYSNVAIYGSLSVSGAKNRIVKTKNYNVRKLNAVESADCVFQDYGGGKTNEEGYCIIFLDPIFREVISSNIKYRVMLTPYSNNIVYCSNEDRFDDYFIVRSEPYIEFDWHITATQRDYENDRILRSFTEVKDKEKNLADENFVEKINKKFYEELKEEEEKCELTNIHEISKGEEK